MITKYFYLIFCVIVINSQTLCGQTYIIPTVFHILHNYGPENVPDSIILQTLHRLNDDFRKRNADTINIVPAFQSVAADCQIEFHLAQIDPNGNCTNGIDRILATNTYLNLSDVYVNDWPNNKYLNIWVASSRDLYNGEVLTSFPGGNANTDGILCNYSCLVDPFNYRELTKALGHYFNLRHPWGNGTPGVMCGDDSVSDTPLTMGWDHCNLSGSVCNPPVIENVQNFMENSFCNLMFTVGQAARMHAALNSPVGGRNNLWTNANLIATGTDSGYSSICSPKTDFEAFLPNSCVGDTIQFYDRTWNSEATGWLWRFPSGNPSTSTDQNPLIVYSSPGVYSATLISSNITGIDSITKNFFVHITDTARLNLPYIEDFENPASFPGVDGWIENPDNGVSWIRTSNANTTSGGMYAIMKDNFTDSAGEADFWISPSLDFSNVTFPIRFSFNVAYAQRTTFSEDALALYYSKDCGKTWLNISYDKFGSILSTAAMTNSFFIPTSSQWRNETITINSLQNLPNVRFKFRALCDHGNNIFLDDINITGTISGTTDTEVLQAGINVFPNPLTDKTIVSFELNKPSEVSIEIKDLLGQLIKTIRKGNFSAGLIVDKIIDLKPGIYLVEVVVSNRHFIRKIVVA